NALQPGAVARPRRTLRGDGMSGEQQTKAAEPGGETITAERPADEGKYVYCIIESAEPRKFVGVTGIGGRGDEVYTVNHGRLAAAVSDTPVVVYDPTRENALTHEHVIETVMREYTVVPMSFGAIFRTADDVVEFMKDTADALLD